VALVFESDEDANSVVRFKLICDDSDVVVCLHERLSVASPARVLVFGPAPSAYSSCEEAVNNGAVVAIGSLDSRWCVLRSYCRT
jgi:hypothetical protein